MDFEGRVRIISKFKEIAYYLIIAVISIIVTFVVPLVSGCISGDIGMNFPTTMEGWIIYGVVNGGQALANVAVFVLFKQQAKTNVRNDPNYIKANQILNKCIDKTKILPRSPKQMNAAEYSIKGAWVFISTILAGITITSLIISFDFVTFLSCAISTVITLGFGITTMIKNENYWTDEYLRYAEMIEGGHNGN